MKPRLSPSSRVRALILSLLLGSAASALAHRLSDAVVNLDLGAERMTGRVDIPLRDLALVAPLDPNGDGAVTWGELEDAEEAVVAVLDRGLSLEIGGQRLAWHWERIAVSDLAGEPAASFRVSAVLPAKAPGPDAPAVSIRYGLLFDVDPQHRGLLSLTRNGRHETFVFGPDRSHAEFPGIEASRGAGGSARRSLPQFVAEGIHHIWIGTDHILFLLALLIPSVLIRRETGIRPAPDFRAVAVAVLKTVTAFTLAHSLTLALSTLELVRLPSRLVETVIAASVAVAAWNNLVPFFRDRTWWVAFGFGLIHGFGFASVLSDLSLPTADLVSGLLGFNLGVELGQLAMVAAFLPVAFLLRSRALYQRGVLQFGSAAILLTALIWAVERGAGLS